jgi:hypothetical protein
VKRAGWLAALGVALALPSALLAQTRPQPSASSAPASSSSSAWPELPSAKSARPKPGEWKDATVVRFDRVSARAARCEARVVREWLRFRCERDVAAVSQLGGTIDDVAALAWQDSKDPKITGGEVIFPLRRGDRRAIQVWTFAPGYDGPLTVTPDFVIQEDWLDGRRPVILAL